MSDQQVLNTSTGPQAAASRRPSPMSTSDPSSPSPSVTTTTTTTTTRSSRSPVGSLTQRMSRQHLQIDTGGSAAPQPGHDASLAAHPTMSSSARFSAFPDKDSASSSPAGTQVSHTESTGLTPPIFLSQRHRRQHHHSQFYSRPGTWERMEPLVASMVAHGAQCTVHRVSLTARSPSAVDPSSASVSSLSSTWSPPIPPGASLSSASAPTAQLSSSSYGPRNPLPIEPDPSQVSYFPPPSRPLEADPAFTGGSDIHMEEDEPSLVKESLMASIRTQRNISTMTGVAGMPDEVDFPSFPSLLSERVVRSRERALRCNKLVWSRPRMRKREKSRTAGPASKRDEASGTRRRNTMSSSMPADAPPALASATATAALKPVPIMHRISTALASGLPQPPPPHPPEP